MIIYIVDDTLHTMDLGLLQRYVGKTFWAVLSVNFHKSKLTNKEDRCTVGVVRLRVDLRKYYKAERCVQRGSKISKIKKLTLNSIGPENNPCLKSKGGGRPDVC